MRCLDCGRRLRQPNTCPIHGTTAAASLLTEQPPAPVPAPKIEGFRATTLVGRGGHGSVYAGVRQSDGMRVAIKVSRADQLGAGARL
ncbi:MAG TPA: hypothetical protein VKE49_06350, partial [Myxococcaceae bacterium]|nr:hypothetical protein [Myxococcaceae bacterium]